MENWKQSHALYTVQKSDSPSSSSLAPMAADGSSLASERDDGRDDGRCL